MEGFLPLAFENIAGYIGRALVTDTDLNSIVVTIDNLQSVSAFPSPCWPSGPNVHKRWSICVVAQEAEGRCCNRRLIISVATAPLAWS